MFFAEFGPTLAPDLQAMFPEIGRHCPGFDQFPAACTACGQDSAKFCLASATFGIIRATLARIWPEVDSKVALRQNSFTGVRGPKCLRSNASNFDELSKIAHCDHPFLVCASGPAWLVDHPSTAKLAQSLGMRVGVSLDRAQL